nr:hypothetical protein [Arthrobacter livingstonensis]
MAHPPVLLGADDGGEFAATLNENGLRLGPIDQPGQVLAGLGYVDV